MGVTLYGSEGRAQLVGQIIYRPIDPLERDIEKNRQCQGEYRRCTEQQQILLPLPGKYAFGLPDLAQHAAANRLRDTEISDSVPGLF